MKCMRDGLMVVRLSDQECKNRCVQLSILMFKFVDALQHCLNSDQAKSAD